LLHAERPPDRKFAERGEHREEETADDLLTAACRQLDLRGHLTGL